MFNAAAVNVQLLDVTVAAAHQHKETSQRVRFPVNKFHNFRNVFLPLLTQTSELPV